jgi:iron complex outermembrane receptor protein
MKSETTPRFVFRAKIFFSRKRSFFTHLFPLFFLLLVFKYWEGPLKAETNAFEATPAQLKHLTLEELMNLDVTSVSKEPEPFAEAPAAIQVITGDEIRRSGASSIPEALRLASNLEVAQQNSHDWAISARGFNANLANKLLVLIDGRAVYTPLYGGVRWDVQDYLLEDIDRIEVISGPGGTLWGANAVNGVINIITKSAKATQGTYLEVGGGSFLEDFAGMRYGGTLASNVYFRVYGKYFDRSAEVFPNGKDASDSWRMGQGGFRIDSERNELNPLTLQADFYFGDENLSYGHNTFTSGGNILGRWTHFISDDSDLSLQTYYDRTHLSFPYPDPLGRLHDDLDTFDVDFQHRFSLGDRNKVVWGANYRFTHEDENNARQVRFLPSILNHNLFSGFVQDEIELHEKLFLTLGTKLEHYDYTGLEIEPSARLQWNINSNHMVWSAVSRAVRTPSRYDRDLEIPTFLPEPIDKFQTGGDDFKSETVIAYELGYRAQMGRTVSASISLFYNDYDHLRSLNPGVATNFFLPHTFGNDLEGETYGTELSLTYQVLDWWRLRGGYDLLKEHLRVKPGHVDLNDTHGETADPQQQFSLRSSMDLTKDIELDAGLRWVDMLWINQGATVKSVPSYFEVDARLAWQVTKDLEISVVGQNLLHDHHAEYGYPNSAREEISRAVYGKVTWRF